MVLSFAEALGSRVIRATMTLGQMGMFLGASPARAAVPPYRVRNIVKQVHFIGVKSLFVIILTAIFDVVGIVGGSLVGVKLLGVNAEVYLGQMEASVVLGDVTNGIWKSLAFALLIAWVCPFKGDFARHGAEGVSHATTSAVVVSSVLVLVCDYFLTSILL